jgi:AmmeMemoRadiSam system protein A
MDPDRVSAVMATQMTQGVPGLVTCACGEGPIIVAMRVAQALGADHAQVLRYANSGDVGGDPNRVVGYGAVMFWRWQPPRLTESQQSALLSIARRGLEEYMATDEAPAFDPPDDPTLSRHLGAFVTLKLDGELRGCIGRTLGDAPLYQTVAQVAVEAAVNDPRFPPLPADQLDDVEVEVSVLSPFKRVRDVHDESEIEVGRHGLYLLYGQQRGLLLPQVPVEEGWERAEFLEQICFKSGLPGDCWERATLYTFTAEVFSENLEH